MPEDFFSATQIAGYVAFAVTVAAFWQKKDRYLLLLNGAAATCWTVQYLMLGTLTGAATEILVVARSLLSAFMTEQKHKHLAVGFFITAFITAGVLTYHAPYDLLAVVSCLIATVSMIYLKQLHLRYGMLAATILWTLFNFYAGTIGGVAAGLVLATVKIITIFRIFWDQKRLKAAK